MLHFLVSANRHSNGGAAVLGWHWKASSDLNVGTCYTAARDSIHESKKEDSCNYNGASAEILQNEANTVPTQSD